MLSSLDCTANLSEIRLPKSWKSRQQYVVRELHCEEHAMNFTVCVAKISPFTFSSWVSSKVAQLAQIFYWLLQRSLFKVGKLLYSFFLALFTKIDNRFLPLCDELGYALKF